MSAEELDGKILFSFVKNCINSYLPQLVILAGSEEVSWSVPERGSVLVLPVLFTVCPCSVSSYGNLSVDICPVCWHLMHPVVSSPCSAVQHKWSSSSSKRNKSRIPVIILIQEYKHT